METEYVAKLEHHLE